MYTLGSVRDYRQNRGKKKLILDTNVLLLFLVGACDTDFLPKHACTEKYKEIDYELLVSILRYFDSEVIITPHILAEFSNLSRRDIKEPRIHYYLATVRDRLKTYKEEYISLERLIGADVKLLALYGFPDMSLIEASKKVDAVLITDDIGLGLYADSCQIPNIKFSAVRADNLLTLTK